MDGLVVGIDCGSQSAKVGIFGADGTLHGWGQRTLRPMHRPQPGVVVHPHDDIWESIVEACNQAVDSLRRAGSDPARIVAIGLCTIRCCKAFLDERGHLVEPLISWMDDRAYQPYRPDVAGVRWATTSSGYVTMRLTGNPRDTAANCIEMQWPIDSERWQWATDDSEFERCGVDPQQLFTLDHPATIAGQLTEPAADATGLPAGIAVIHTANDKAVEHLGAGPANDDEVVLSLGTYICAMTTAPSIDNRAASWTNFGCVAGTYLQESSGVRRGMWTLSWLLDLLGPELAERAQRDGVDRETLLEAEAAATPAGSDGLLTVLDWLATTDQPHRKGIMLGFDARHTRGHLYRSVMEAIAMSMAVYSEAMMHELGRPIHSVIASGGGSRSALFTSIIADAVAAPVFAADEPASPASRGAAICARAAIDGVSPTDVQRSWARPRRVTNPHPERSAVYRDLRPFVTDHIRTANDPILRALSNIEKAPR